MTQPTRLLIERHASGFTVKLEFEDDRTPYQMTNLLTNSYAFSNEGDLDAALSYLIRYGQCISKARTDIPFPAEPFPAGPAPASK